MIIELPYEEIERVYADYILPYFPADEVKPLALIKKMHKEGGYKILAIMEEEHPENIAGCAFVAIHPGCRACLLDYYAIREDLRCRHYGSKMLQELAVGKQIPYPIMIETELVEAAEDEKQRAQRIRRNAFYEKNKVVKTDLITDIFGVYFSIWILGDPGEISLKEEMERCYRYMLPPALYEENCRIPAQFSLQPSAVRQSLPVSECPVPPEAVLLRFRLYNILFCTDFF